MAGGEKPGQVRIGVTGHRFLAEVAKLRESIERALHLIEQRYPGCRLAAVSPLAEGADRLVAHAVLERGGSLIVPLPLPAEDYLTDFTAKASQAEFRALLALAAEVIELPATPTRNEAYEQVGLWVLDHSDALIAVYDGKPAQGRGGTAEIAALAIERGLPVLHIKAGNRKPGTTQPTSLGPEQGELVLHNLQPASGSGNSTPA